MKTTTNSAITIDMTFVMDITNSASVNDHPHHEKQQLYS